MLFLAGCNNDTTPSSSTSSSETPTPTPSTSSTPQPANVDSPYALDFVTDYGSIKSAFPYVSDGETVNDVTINGLDFVSAGCFVDSYEGVGYFMMKTKWDTPAPAFIASAQSLGKITKVEFVTGASASNTATYKITLSKTPITAADTEGAVTVAQGTEYSATATEEDGYGYFAISSCNYANKKNGQLASLKVTFTK